MQIITFVFPLFPISAVNSIDGISEIHVFKKKKTGELYEKSGTLLKNGFLTCMSF